MGLKERLKRQLQNSRGMSEKLLATFTTPEQWTYQLCPQANHALWFAGHMATTDNFFLTLVGADQVRDLPGFSERFGMGSKPTGKTADYPPAAEVLGIMRERRQALLSALERMSEEELQRPTKPGAPSFLSDNGSVFEAAAWHEGLHAGQVTMIRRALGMSPLVGGAPT